VPHASSTDVHARIEAQIERFAPGFRNRIVARHVMTARDMEAHNPNLVGGDVTGGANTLWQLFRRPTSLMRPYRTALPGVYLCSASTPPGGGVHGMCGHHAALAALRDEG
jgi:phytoene dehydrogenase-like protein